MMCCVTHTYLKLNLFKSNLTEDSNVLFVWQWGKRSKQCRIYCIYKVVQDLKVQDLVKLVDGFKELAKSFVLSYSIKYDTLYSFMHFSFSLCCSNWCWSCREEPACQLL